uniref:EZH inhibitory protein n=1 Tax=Ursus americanus TaxID=9643 RepID=A0A452R0Y9_URSAM
MATPSSEEKALKQQQGEMPAGPKNEVAPAPGDARGVGNPDPGASVPSISSSLSPSGGGAPHSGTAGSSASALAAVGAIAINGEGPELPSTARVQERERADLQGGRSPHAELRCVVPGAGQGLQASHAGGVAAMVQAMRGVGQASGPPTLTTSPGKGRGRKLTHHEEAAQAQKPPWRRCLFPGLPRPQCPVTLPPSSPGAQLSASRRHASAPGPALRSSRRRASAQTASSCSRGRASAPGKVVAAMHPRRPAAHAALSRGASALGSAQRNRASARGPASSSRASGLGPALNNRASPPGPALRSRASGSGPALRSRANPIGPAVRNGCPTPGFVLRSRTIQRSSPRSRASLPVRTGLSPPSSSGVALRRLVCQSSSSSPNPEVPSLGAQPRWHAVRMRASSPSPPGRPFPFPEQCGESSSSSSSTSSSGTSSPKFSGLGSISTPSPASLRRALLPELDALSPLSPGEEAETGSMSSSPTPPVV